MSLKNYVAALLAAASLGVAAPTDTSSGPDKPAMAPPYNTKKFAANLQATVKPRASTKHSWNDNYIPQSCKKIATKFKLDPNDFSVFDVKYDDCAEPWTMCRHKDAKFTEKDIVDNFGSMPVHVRSYIRHFIGIPAHSNGAVAFTYASGDTVFEGDPMPGVLAHEISHSIDFNAFPQFKSPFSHNPEWTAEYAKDTHTVNGYGRTNWLEDFAATGRVAFYDTVVPGGFRDVAPNWQQISHQFQTYEKYCKDIITPGGTCGKRFPNSPKVSKSGTNLEPVEHDVFPRAEHNITNIVAPPEYEEIVMYNFHGDE